jgi:uncharacterized protein YegL
VSIEESFTPSPANNDAAVLPLVLLVDLSNSMNEPDGESPGRRRLDHLRDALERMLRELNELGDLRRGGEIAILGFGGETVEPLDLRGGDAGVPGTSPFVRLVDARLPRRLRAAGATPLAVAIEHAADLVAERTEQLRGRPRYRANLWILSDGQNSDVEGYFAKLPTASLTRLRDLENAQQLLVFCGALPGANVAELERISPATFPARDAAFADIIKMIVVSSSSAGQWADAPAQDIYDELEEVYRRWGS